MIAPNFSEISGRNCSTNFSPSLFTNLMMVIKIMLINDDDDDDYDEFETYGLALLICGNHCDGEDDDADADEDDEDVEVTYG